MFLLLLIQWFHILTGIIWFGGYVFLDFVLWPTLLRLPAQQATFTYSLISKFAGPVMATSGSLVVLLGIARGAWLGPIKSFRVLFSSSYGVTWLIALAISLTLIIWGAGWHDRFIGPIWEQDSVKTGIVDRLRLSTIFEMSCFSLVLTCMVLMGVGL
ncbi:hypothetical protein KSC_025980 [Ktedonobacter sp. SOSP1-52]|uniref:hypothetical protein n=1 Tax=Ktedonobacter sp. SOSP1-52 TaxID=2778366 RepID=UPI0019150A94|nr:hypothetical protein [Ktedonobacter sp. SOSP1-52]GHO63706.1 hypothetical protein KSC_025980 [Ktedonobacter sp. SOSP1-52]